MSAKNLAARLDALEANGAFISEGETSVTVSNLDFEVAVEILELASALGWPAHAFDSAGTEWALSDIEEEFSPFRVDLDKPSAPEGILRLLTNSGFAVWLERENASPNWQIAQLTCNIITVGGSFTPWDDSTPEAREIAVLRSPRDLVRELGGQHAVPATLDRCLLPNPQAVEIKEPARAVWANWAARMLVLALPDEHDSDRKILRFKGPPRLELAYSAKTMPVAAELGPVGFETLQIATAWVFEVERESEMRHILLATELARCGGVGYAAAPFLRDNLSAALEGAKTAYQVQLSGMSSDALKTLAELRKSVTDETAKVADATRQIITAVASALAVGAGLIVARLSTTASPLVIALVMVMAGAYVGITIISGVMFTLLQRNVRKEWQPRLYRFLSKPDYDALVGRPARSAELTLWWCSAFGAIAIVVMAVAVWVVSPPINAVNNKRATGAEERHAKAAEKAGSAADVSRRALPISGLTTQPDHSKK